MEEELQRLKGKLKEPDNSHTQDINHTQPVIHEKMKKGQKRVAHKPTGMLP